MSMNLKLINLMSMNFKLINLMSMNFKSINLMSMNFKSINLKLIVLFSALYSFLCFFILVKFYSKKCKKFKTDLITSSILLLILLVKTSTRIAKYDLQVFNSNLDAFENTFQNHVLQYSLLTGYFGETHPLLYKNRACLFMYLSPIIHFSK